METLFIKHAKKSASINLDFQRETMNRIAWDERIIGIMGQRGIGKTTLLLQYIRKNFKSSNKTLYVSMDDLYFSSNKLIHLAEEFVVKGGKCLFLDELHRYPNWAQEIKNICDDLPELKVVFTGSSILGILNSKVDLSRRVAYYHMPGMSFREYVNRSMKTNYSVIQLNDLLQNHTKIALELKQNFIPLQLFQTYQQQGYFPFYNEAPKTFMQRVEEIVNTTIDIDIMQLKGLNTNGILKLKQLLYVIAQSVPFKPNIVKLSERIGVNRNTLLSYIKNLEDSSIINTLYASVEGVGVLQKPEKIYLENNCFNYALCQKEPNIGTLRETFFISQMKENHQLTYTEKGDFIVDGKFVFEVGGRNKGMKQVSGVQHAWVAADDMDVGVDKKIPLWLFGFTY